LATSGEDMPIARGEEKAKIGTEMGVLNFKERVFIINELHVETASFPDMTPYDEHLDVAAFDTSGGVAGSPTLNALAST
jgi:hypothetical protein